MADRVEKAEFLRAGWHQGRDVQSEEGVAEEAWGMVGDGRDSRGVGLMGNMGLMGVVREDATRYSKPNKPNKPIMPN